MKLFGIAMLGLIALLGLLGLYYQFQQPTLVGIGLFLAIAITPVCLISKLIIEENGRKAFIRWLTANAAQIDSGKLRYDGYPINAQTVLRTYYFTVSAAIVSMKVPTRFFIDQCHSTGLHSAANTLISFIFGWWGFPWGIVYTIQSIAKNLKGGDSTTVGDLLKMVGGEPAA